MKTMLYIVPICVILFNILHAYNCTGILVTGYCGDPGHPVKSQVSPAQSIYNEDENVVYKCDDYISFKQYRKCSKGQWMGKHAVCAYFSTLFRLSIQSIGNAFRDNDVKVAKIYNSLNNKLIHEYNINGSLEPFAKFGNSFIAE
ncbi:unnamed protein product, partial [Medioppia subpectinata]